MNRNTFIYTIITVLTLSFLTATASAQNSLIWDASAERDGMVLESTYSELYLGDTADQRFEVRVSNAPANMILKVWVRGKSIGVISTDANGFGRLFKGRPDVPLDNDGRPDAPRIETGMLILITNVAGRRIIHANYAQR